MQIRAAVEPEISTILPNEFITNPLLSRRIRCKCNLTDPIDLGWRGGFARGVLRVV